MEDRLRAAARPRSARTAVEVGDVDLEVDRRHVVAGRDEVGDEVLAEHPGRAGDQDPHDELRPIDAESPTMKRYARGCASAAGDHDVAADQARLDARVEVLDAAVLQHDRVLDLGPRGCTTPSAMAVYGPM